MQAEIDHAGDPVAETAWLADIVKAECCGLPSVAVAYADLRHADHAGLLARHAAYPLVRGICQEAWFDPDSTRADIPRDDFLKDAAWRRGYRRLADFGLSFDLLVWPWQLSEAARFVAAVPEVPVMVEHMGCPVDRSPDGVRVWRDGLRAMAGVAHAYLKLSAMSLLGPPAWTIDAVRPFILDAIDAFGPDRCMFGSNFPVERLSCGYTRLWAAYAQVTAGFTEAERRDLFAGTAARAYRIGG